MMTIWIHDDDFGSMMMTWIHDNDLNSMIINFSNICGFNIFKKYQNCGIFRGQVLGGLGINLLIGGIE